MIHQEDPNHLATTMLAEVNKKLIEFIKERCPDLDLLSVQVYGGLPKYRRNYVLTDGRTVHGN